MDGGLKAALEGALLSATGRPFSIRAARAVSGGCIHRSFVLQDGKQRWFAKTNDAALADVLAAEADGLAALAQAGARVPAVVAHGADGARAWLILEHLDLQGQGDHARLGRALAALHAVRGVRFGWVRDNYIGSTPQSNRRHATWAAFWREERLRPQLALAAEDGHLGVLEPGEQLCERLDDLLDGHEPAPSLLHGDLWSGNAGFAAGEAVMFDPAVYYGDREADLAMTELFGGFAASFYAAYREAAPPGAGYERRRELYQLYHVLNHAHLFGGSYASQAERMLARLLALMR